MCHAPIWRAKDFNELDWSFGDDAVCFECFGVELSGGEWIRFVRAIKAVIKANGERHVPQWAFYAHEKQAWLVGCESGERFTVSKGDFAAVTGIY